MCISDSGQTIVLPEQLSSLDPNKGQLLIMALFKKGYEDKWVEVAWRFWFDEKLASGQRGMQAGSHPERSLNLARRVTTTLVGTTIWQRMVGELEKIYSTASRVADRRQVSTL